MRATLKPSSEIQPVATRWILISLFGAMLTAWGTRSLLASLVFLDDGSVLLDIADSAYHSRRSLFTFANFPAVLLHDPYMAYPDGSPIPFPPLYDWLLGGVARLFGNSQLVFEGVVAWAAVFFATATLLPIYGLGRMLFGGRVGVVAAWIFAVLPASSVLSSVGNLDHHAAVGFIGASWLWSSIREIRDDSGHRVLRAALHGTIVAAMALVWSGSLLYIGLGEGARLLVGGILWSRRKRLLAQSGGALLAAALIAPWVAMAPTPIDGPFASSALSWLQVLVLVELGALAAIMAGFERLRPEPRSSMRALRAITTCAAIAVPLLAIPGLLENLESGVRFVSGEGGWARTNPEQQPLFSTVSQALRLTPTARFGWLVYLIPILPVGAAFPLLRRERCESTVLLLIWTAILTVLALLQVRFAHDLAPLASVIFAGALAALHVRIARFLPRPAASLASVVLTLALLWPALSEVQLPRARWALQSLTLGNERPSSPLGPGESQMRFALSVRRATPETSGFLDDRITPEYGLLVDPSFGHSFQYWSRRPVPANNFGPYLDREKFDDSNTFFFGADADLAIAALDRLDSRFIVTAARPFYPPMPYGQRLHRGDGYRSGDSVCGPCLRLVTEGPANGTVMFPLAAGRSFIPYKLFERVSGARIEIQAPPGAPVKLELELQTPIGRRIVFEVSTETDHEGWARLRVPYATDVAPPVHATGPYRVHIGDAVYWLDVPDAAVRASKKIVLETAGLGPSPPQISR